MRRYFGRARGKHRSQRQRLFRIFFITGLAAAVLGLILIAVLILNPGGNRPGPQKGSITESVRPTGDPSSPSGQPRPCHHRHCW